MGIQTKPGICRLCPAYCQIVAEVEDGVVVKVTGDKDNEFFKGYTCPKGRRLPEQHNGKHRLLNSLRRNTEGNFEPVASSLAMDEIAEKIQKIVREHGPRSIAIYGGTGQLASGVAPSVAVSLLAAIGSPMHFTSSAIDQPGKAIAMAAHGLCAGGELDFEAADTWMIVGANPVISKASGAPGNNPAQRLKEAQERGLKLIVIDPRKTETAKRAYIYLQAKPGEDPAVLAGLIHVIVNQNQIDESFLAADVDGFEGLVEAVAPFTPEYVARRAGIDRKDLIEAANAYSSAVGKTRTPFQKPSAHLAYLPVI
jgi:anaerobic selenocysteine-containing dehydrogenase